MHNLNEMQWIALVSTSITFILHTYFTLELIILYKFNFKKRCNIMSSFNYDHKKIISHVLLFYLVVIFTIYLVLSIIFLILIISIYIQRRKNYLNGYDIDYMT